MRAFGLLAALVIGPLSPTASALAQDASPPAEPVRTHAQWVRGPITQDMIWPGYAFYARLSGRVVLDCVITEKQKLKPCAVAEETPKDQGFAEAAITFLEPTKMRPPTIDGVPVKDSHAEITIDFNGPKQSVRFWWRTE